MMHAFEIKTPQGRLLREYFANTDPQLKTAQIEQEFTNEEWYQINHHECFHDEGKPCEPWVTVAQKGEVPRDDMEL